MSDQIDEGLAEAAGIIKAKRTRQRSRQGLKPIMCWQPPEVSKAIKALALEQDTTVQSLMTDGINRVLKAHGKPPIAI